MSSVRSNAYWVDSILPPDNIWYLSFRVAGESSKYGLWYIIEYIGGFGICNFKITAMCYKAMEKCSRSNTYADLINLLKGLGWGTVCYNLFDSKYFTGCKVLNTLNSLSLEWLKVGDTCIEIVFWSFLKCNRMCYWSDCDNRWCWW